MKRLIEKADILIEALPYIRSFSGKTIVIKYGGKAMQDDDLKHKFALDLVLMKYVGINPVIVHGGGPQINEMMNRLGIKPRFIEGIRVTDQDTMKIVEMVLGGIINKEIVGLINKSGGKAVGLTGKDGDMIRAKKISQRITSRKKETDTGNNIDMGLAGEVESIEPEILRCLDENRFIPVIAPMGIGSDGKTYNINADLVAGSLAAALKAEKLVVLTNVKGILDKDKSLIPSISKKEIESLIRDKVISEGMLPKVDACLLALEGGVNKAHIINGGITHALILEIFTDKGIGTEIIV
ncbi:MAG: acetylglutamate kinase [Nitrospirota bacterium]